MNDTQGEKTNKARALRPDSTEFKDFIASGWGDVESDASRLGSAPYAAARRHRLSHKFTGTRIVIPAGDLKPRANDTDYRFRPLSDFAYLTGLGTDHEPGAVLVFEPTDDGRHDVALYLIPPAGPGEEGFYADPRSGEFWIGRRPTLAEMQAMTGIVCRPLAELPSDIDLEEHPSPKVSRKLSKMRMVKDEWEIQQIREAVDATIAGFERVVKELPRAVEHKRGERVIEATFDGHAREEGNAVGYETIAAAGERTPRRCTGSPTTASCARETCCCSTPASRSRASIPRTSRGRCRSAARSPLSSARSTTWSSRPPMPPSPSRVPEPRCAPCTRQRWT